MGDLKYTGRVTGVGSGPIPDGFDKISYGIVDVHIPITERNVSDKNLRLYIEGGRLPSSGELVDIELSESAGFVDYVRQMETGKGMLKVKSHDII